MKRRILWMNIKLQIIILQWIKFPRVASDRQCKTNLFFSAMSVAYIRHSDNTNINKAPTQVFTDPTLPASGTENLKGSV